MQVGAIGMTTTTPSTRFVSEEDIKEAYNSLGPTFGGNKEDYFGVVYLAKHFNIPLNEAAPYVAIGGTDAGLDAYYLDKDRKALYMYAFRWTNDHMSFRVALERLGKNGINKIFFDPSKSADDHPMILSLKTSLFQNW